MPSTPSRAPTFGFGQFFGTPELRHELSGFSLARIAATRPPAEVPDHVHDSAHLVFVIEGGYVTGAASAEPGRSPRLVYNPPGTRHADRFRDNRGIFFTLSVADRHLESLRGTAIPSRPLALASGPAVRLVRRLTRLCVEMPRRSRARLEGICFEVLTNLADEAARSRPRVPPWLLATRETLCRQTDEPPSVRDLAHAAGVHPVHLIRAFHRFFGVTPAGFARERRLVEAARLLLETELPIVEVALATGFADQSHFTRAFRRAHGAPPAAFRRERGLRRKSG